MVHGALVRSRFQNINQIDAPTNFFFNLEEKTWTGKINELRSESGTLLTDRIDIRRRRRAVFMINCTSVYVT